MERIKKEAPQSKLADAVQDFRSGYDKAALALLKPLADEGQPKAQYWLADMYENGLGVTKNLLTARDLLEKSAAQSFVPAEERLGDLYLHGNETLQDFGKAQSWLHTAAIAGDSDAQRQLGQIFALGLGVPRDLPEAYGWYENAVLGGDGMASHLRDDLVARMAPPEIAKGEQDAKNIAAQIKPAKP
jgi:TPR repeat protein